MFLKKKKKKTDGGRPSRPGRGHPWLECKRLYRLDYVCNTTTLMIRDSVSVIDSRKSLFLSNFDSISLLKYSFITTIRLLLLFSFITSGSSFSYTSESSGLQNRVPFCSEDHLCSAAAELRAEQSVLLQLVAAALLVLSPCFAACVVWFVSALGRLARHLNYSLLCPSVAENLLSSWLWIFLSSLVFSCSFLAVSLLLTPPPLRRTSPALAF